MVHSELFREQQVELVLLAGVDANVDQFGLNATDGVAMLGESSSTCTTLAACAELLL